MRKLTNSLTFGFLVASTSFSLVVSGQYWRNNITQVWTAPIQPVAIGNGVFLSPTGTTLVVVSTDARVTAFSPSTGTQLWTYTPPDPDTSASYGGAHFSNYNGQPYVLYSVITNAIFADIAASTMIALDMLTGQTVFQTAEMAGVTRGTPVSTKDGSHILTTHNVDGKIGFFSVFNFGIPEPNITFTNGIKFPFGSVGFCYDPIEGSWPEGAGNPNDLFMFTADTPSDQATAGPGQMYGFQIPVVNPFRLTPLTVVRVGGITSFQSGNPPVFGRMGYLMYQGVTKSEIRGWEATGLPRNYFKANSQFNLSFDLGYPRFIYPWAPPTLSADPSEPIVYGPTSAAQIFRAPYDLSASILHNMSVALTNKVLLSPDDLYVYYANADGILAQLDATTLDLVWNVSAGGAVRGEIAQSIDGVYLYVANSVGLLIAFQVKEPSIAASVSPSSAPSKAASVTPSSAPSITASVAPSSARRSFCQKSSFGLWSLIRRWICRVRPWM